ELERTIHRCYDAAGLLTARDVTGLLDLDDPTPAFPPGLESLAAVSLADCDFLQQEDLAIVSEAALWLLARRDGLGIARAALASEVSDGDLKALSCLLQGQWHKARSSADGSELRRFID